MQQLLFLALMGALSGSISGALAGGPHGLLLGGTSGLMMGLTAWWITGIILRTLRELRLNRYFTQEQQERE